MVTVCESHGNAKLNLLRVYVTTKCFVLNAPTIEYMYQSIRKEITVRHPLIKYH